jgi:Fe-S oxidoreductase
MSLDDIRESLARCLGCGACRLDWATKEPICPSGLRYGFDSSYAVGRVSLAKAWAAGRLRLDAETAQAVLSCADCRGCDVQCDPALGVSPSKVIAELKKALVETGRLPERATALLRALSKPRPNAYGRPWRERGKWLEGTGFEIFDDHDFLFHVGDAGAFDPVGRGLARAVGRLFTAAGISFGVLGEREPSDGSEAAALGDEALFDTIASSAAALYHELGVRRVVTLSPHSLDAFRTWGLKIETLHYATLLQEDLASGRLNINGEFRARAVFHDPCHLGRRQGEYEAPRALLSAVPGLTILEMERNREHALCCGGGGANVYTAILDGGPLGPARARAEEAKDAGADLLVTACPACRLILEEEAKNLGGLRVLDAAEVLAEAILPKNVGASS